jgi:biotin carboxylase
VLKPRGLGAGRGVLRADDPASFVPAFRRITALLRESEVRRLGEVSTSLLVEDYIPGPEFTVEGLLEAGRLRVLALFDKPDPLEGPTFEETIFVTPSRLPPAAQRALEAEAAAACRALELTEGPVHAELRLSGGRPVLLEVAARTIGGLCSRALRFGTGISLEELVLRHALGLGSEGLGRERRAAGVMMIPVPAAGRLQSVSGLDEARAVPCIEEVTLTVHRGALLVPLPEGHRYVGFIFARADAAGDVEAALREAHRRLRFDVVESR